VGCSRASASLLASGGEGVSPIGDEVSVLSSHVSTARGQIADVRRLIPQLSCLISLDRDVITLVRQLVR
jgi:hypothetical protein